MMDFCREAASFNKAFERDAPTAGFAACFRAPQASRYVQARWTLGPYICPEGASLLRGRRNVVERSKLAGPGSSCRRNLSSRSYCGLRRCAQKASTTPKIISET
jgi:hypothetical protein